MGYWWVSGPTTMAIITGLAVLVPCALAQQATVQPLQGQSPEQMQQDIASCQGAATQATGYSPSQASGSAAPAAPSGKRLKGAAAGAVAGGVRAEARGRDHDDAWDKVDDDRKQDYRQNEAQAAARAGAAVGGVRTRQDRRDTRRQQGQQQQQAGAWNQSYTGCLQGRGYTVTP